MRRITSYHFLLIMMLALASRSHAQERSCAPGGSISFMENRGQVRDDHGRAHPEIAFVAGGDRVNLFLRKDGISYVFTACTTTPAGDRTKPIDQQAPPDDSVSIYRMDMELLGASSDVEIIPRDTLSSFCNFYLAGAPDGIMHVRRYGRILYRNIYEKIDMVIYGSATGVKYDFILHPGARVSDIRIRYRGADSILSRPDGGLRVINPLGYVDEGAPYSIERAGSAIIPQLLASEGSQGGSSREDGESIPITYRVHDDVITFQVPGRNATRTLVIDPALSWSTFFGGGSPPAFADNRIWGIASDGKGGIFITGQSTSTIFPVTFGAFQRTLRGTSDAVIAKLTSGGDTLWSTYYGGSSDDQALDVAADRNGNVVIIGNTFSHADFPVLAATQAVSGGGFSDGFVVKLDGSGVRQWATYYGGDGAEDAQGIAVDSSGEVVITGSTTSSNFPTLTPFQANRLGFNDAFLAKLSPAGVKIWSTYYGGTSSDYAWSVAIDSSRNIFMTGQTQSNDFPILGRSVQPAYKGGGDAFVVKLSSAGAPLWSTFLGGANDDESDGITTDGSGNVFIAGNTVSANFPVTSSAFQRISGGLREMFVVKFNNAGDTLWSTYLGGANNDYALDVAADRSGDVLVTGYTASTNFPVTSDAYQPAIGGSYDAAAVKLDNATGDTLWSTYFGGNLDDYGWAIASDESSNIYITGYTLSTANFPITNRALQGSRSSSFSDAFIAKFGCGFVPSITRNGAVNFCQGDSVVLSAPSGAGYRWSNGATTRSITVKASGRFAVTVTDAGGCIGTSDTIPVQVTSAAAPAIASNNGAIICDGDSVRLTATAGYRRYLWSTGPSDTLAVLTVKRAGTYMVTVTDSNGCRASKDITITVRPRPHPTITPNGSTSLCEGDSVVLDAPAGFNSYRWSNGAAGMSLKVGRSGRYTVTVTDANGCTGISDSILVAVRKKPAPTITPSGSTTLCRGDSVTLTASAGMASYLWSNGATSQSIRVAESGVYIVTVTDGNGCSGRSAEMRVTVNAAPLPSITPSDSVVICDGDSVTLVASDGHAAYLWSNGATTRGITIRQAGSYDVTVTDDNGCTGTALPVVVRVLPAPSVDISGPNSVCPNRTATYSVPATSGAAYNWIVAGGTIIAGAGTNTITVQWGGIGAGSVSVNGTLPATGCPRNRTLTISIDNSLSPAITPGRAPLLCEGDSVRLSAPAGYSSYRWSTGDTAQSIVVRDTGSYTVTVVEAGGCSGTSAPLEVRRNAAPRPSVAGALQFCDGDSTLLVAPTGYASYLWSTGERARSIMVRKGGIYMVTVVDSAGCSGTSGAVTVTVNAAPEPVVDGPNSICIGTGARFQVTGTAGDSYVWRMARGAIVAGAGTSGIVAQWGAAGVDTVIVTETNSSTGCTRSAIYPVVIDSVLHPSVTGPASLCAGDTILLSASSGYTSYRWSNGESTPAIKVWLPGVYFVDVAEAGGCSGRSEEMIVTAAAAPAPSITPGGIVGLCPGDSVMLDAGAGFMLYRWSTGDSSRRIMVREAGRYVATVTNASGCSGTSPEVVVILHAGPVAPSITREGDTLVASVIAASYQWSRDGVAIAGANGRRYRVTDDGSYSVTIADSNGCRALSSPYPIDEGRATVRIIAGSAEAAPGERVSIPLILESSGDLDRIGANGFSATISFNGTLLLPASAAAAGTLSDGKRHIPVTGVRPNGMTAGELLRMEFTAALGDADSTVIAIEKFEWDGVSVVSSTSDGLFRLRGICRSGNTRLVVAEGSRGLKVARPNPTGGMTEIEYEVVEKGRTRLVMSDLLGRTVAMLLDEEIEPGRYVVTFDASSLVSGSYIYTLETPTARLSRMMVVEQ